METTSQSLELGPVLPEPCGYFYRMGAAHGRLFASARKTDEAWASVEAAEEVPAPAGAVGWRARFYAEQELTAALGERASALEEVLDTAAEQSALQIGLMRDFLSGRDDRMVMARYLERVAVLREIVRQERKAEG